MGNFNRGSNFNRGGSGREMYKATCADCGRECEIPFRPTTGRPVYCRDDFKKHSPEGEDRGRGNDRGGSRNFSRDNSRSGDREMFDAVCANCGDRCKVPFQPRGDKEVLCSNCFEEKGGDPRKTSTNTSSSQLNDIQAKLDRILELLSPVSKATETSNKKPQTAKKEIQVAKVQDDTVEEITENVVVEAASEPEETAVEEVLEVKKPKKKKETPKTE